MLSKVSVSVSSVLRLSIVVGILSLKQGVCYGGCSGSSSGFRVFYEKDERYLANLSKPELLQFVAKSGESLVVRLSRRSQTGFVQEGVNLNIDCSLWLASQFRRGRGSIRWYFVQLGNTASKSARLLLCLAGLASYRIQRDRL